MTLSGEWAQASVGNCSPQACGEVWRGLSLLKVSVTSSEEEASRRSLAHLGRPLDRESRVSSCQDEGKEGKREDKAGGRWGPVSRSAGLAQSPRHTDTNSCPPATL